MNKIDYVKRKRILKVVSILASVIIWIFVTQTENPTMDYSIKGLEISIQNENHLDSRGLVITNKEEIGEASVVIRGRRRDLINVLGSVYANVDVSNIQSAGEYKLKIDYEIPNSTISIAKKKTGTAIIRVEEIEEKEIELRVVQTGKVDNTSYVVESIPEKKSIIVKGASRDIENIHHASVYVDVSDMTGNNEAGYDVVCENSDGDTIKTEGNVIIENKTVNVENHVYEKVTLGVRVVVPDEFDEYAVNILTTNKEKLAVGLKSDEGKEVSELVAIIQADEIMLGTGNYNAKISVPDGIYIDPKSTDVELSIEVVKKEKKVLTLPVKLKNEKKKKCKLLQENVEVTVLGPKDKLKKENIEAYIDLDKIKNDGEMTVYVDFDTKVNSIEILEDDVKVNIVVG